MRWQAGDGPGARRRLWKNRIKRWLVDRATRDPRIRRMALNRIFSDFATDGVLCLVPFATGAGEESYQVYVDPRDDRIAYSVLSGREWQRAELEHAFLLAEAAGRLEPGGTFLDVGANIGLMTLYALLSGRFDRAIAIEPDPWNRSILEQNLAINDFDKRVTVFAGAASSSPGTLELNRDRKNLGAHSLERGFVMSPGSVETVRVERLDDIVTGAGHSARDISFVKIDVEGHEFEVLAGMTDVLAVQPPIMAEITFDAASTSDADRLRQILQPGYSRFHVLDQAQRSGALSDLEARASQHELLFL